MLAPNWEDHDAEKNPIINYCRNCENCTKLFEYNEVFKQQGFWSFNRHITCWNLFDPDWSSKSRIFKLLSVRKVHIFKRIK